MKEKTIKMLEDTRNDNMEYSKIATDKEGDREFLIALIAENNLIEEIFDMEGIKYDKDKGTEKTTS